MYYHIAKKIWLLKQTSVIFKLFLEYEEEYIGKLKYI